MTQEVVHKGNMQNKIGDGVIEKISILKERFVLLRYQVIPFGLLYAALLFWYVKNLSSGNDLKVSGNDNMCICIILLALL